MSQIYLFTYGEMWLLKKISCEIQILNEKVGKLMIENSKLEKENKKLKEYNGELIENHKKDIAILCEENKKLKEELEEAQCSFRMENDEVGYLKRENKKLKEKIERLEKCFKKGGFNPQDVECLMEEDKLQELRDLGEI